MSRCLQPAGPPRISRRLLRRRRNFSGQAGQIERTRRLNKRRPIRRPWWWWCRPAGALSGSVAGQSEWQRREWQLFQWPARHCCAAWGGPAGALARNQPAAHQSRDLAAPAGSERRSCSGIGIANWNMRATGSRDQLGGGTSSTSRREGQPNRRRRFINCCPRSSASLAGPLAAAAIAVAL
jgi:hypothetical protein